MKTITLLIIAMMIAVGYANAQQDPIYSQYMNNPLSINPAFAGSNGNFELLGLSRIQWTGFEGAPRTHVLSVNTPIEVHHLGLGFSLVHDQVGPVKKTSTYFDFSYKMQATEDGFINFGLKSGFTLYSAHYSQLYALEEDDQALAGDAKGMFLPNFGFGIQYYTDQYYVGLSIPKLFQNKLSHKGVETSRTSKEIRHYFLMGGGIFDVYSDIRLKPSFMAGFVKGAPMTLDLSIMGLVYDQLWVGTMYRWGDSFGFLVQYQATEQLRIGYALDLTTSKFRGYNNGTHEIMFRYDLDLGDKFRKNVKFF